MKDSMRERRKGGLVIMSYWSEAAEVPSLGSVHHVHHHYEDDHDDDEHNHQGDGERQILQHKMINPGVLYA